MESACQSESQPEKRMCGSTVKSTYKLTQDDLDHIPHVCVRNPHYRCASDMRLYTRQDVEDYIAVHYHPDNVERRKQARQDAKQAALCQKKEREEKERQDACALVDRVYQRYQTGLQLRENCREQNGSNSAFLALPDDVLGHIARAMVDTSGLDTIYSYDMAARDLLSLKRVSKSASLWRMIRTGLHMLYGHICNRVYRPPPQVEINIPYISFHKKISFYKSYFSQPFMAKHPFHGLFCEELFTPWCVTDLADAQNSMRSLILDLLRGKKKSITTKEIKDFCKAYKIERYSTRTKEQLIIACLEKFIIPNALDRLGASSCCYGDAPLGLVIVVTHLVKCQREKFPLLIKLVTDLVRQNEIQGIPAHENTPTSNVGWRTFIYRHFGEDLHGSFLDLLENIRVKERNNVLNIYYQVNNNIKKKAIKSYQELHTIRSSSSQVCLPGMSKKNTYVSCQLNASTNCTGLRHGRCHFGFCEQCCIFAHSCAQESGLFSEHELQNLYAHFC